MSDLDNKTMAEIKADKLRALKKKNSKHVEEKMKTTSINYDSELKACIAQSEKDSQKCNFEGHRIESQDDVVKALYSAIRHDITITDALELSLKQIVMEIPRYEFSNWQYMNTRSDYNKNREIAALKQHYDKIECQDKKKMISDCMEKVSGYDTQDRYESCVGITNKCYMMEGHHDNGYHLGSL